MIQDTRDKRRLDDLPNLRIQGYHTYHRTMDEGGHGMVTLIKHTIPSETAVQVHLGDGTETLSTRIWINTTTTQSIQSGWRTGYNNSTY